MKITKQLVTPTKLFIVTWLFSLIAAYLGPKEAIYQTHGVVNTTFTLEGLVWIGMATSVFIAGVVLANRKQVIIESFVQPSMTSDRESWERWKIQTGFISAFLCGFGIVSLLAYWTGLAIMEVGSPSLFIQSLHQNWHRTGRIWIAQKPFPGARLLYTGLISVVIFATSGIAYIKRENSRDGNTTEQYELWIFLLFIGIIPLTILPLFVSQRLLLGSAIIGAGTTYVIINPDGISIKYPITFTIFGFGIWTFQEVVRVGFAPGAIISSIQFSIDRLLFYFSNDIGNLNRGVTFITERTYGFRSFRFIFRYLFIEDTIQSQYLGSFNRTVETYRGGGTFTGLGEPYIDFGVFGLVLIFLWGYAAQLTFRHSEQSVFAAQVYGLFASSIILSWHFAALSNPIFWFNIAFFGVFMLGTPYISLNVL